MGTKFRRGFTIIELLLFVSITGLLTVSLIVGWTTAINSQSYRDSLRSLATQLQGEYVATTNVTNERDPAYACSKSGASATSVTIDKVVASGGVPRGQSNCVEMGRYVYVDGSEVRSNAVIGIRPSTAPGASDSEDTVIKSYLPTRLAGEIIPDQRYVVPWSSKAYNVNDPSSTARFVLLIVRSPATGLTYSYTRDIGAGPAPTLPSPSDMIADGVTKGRTLCMEPNAAIAGGRMAVVIGANAASPSSIKVVGDAGVTGC